MSEQIEGGVVDAPGAKPLTAEYVGEVHRAAMRAIGDVNTRRRWPDHKHGSPVATMLLCAEVARLNIERAELLAALQELAAAETETQKTVGDRDANDKAINRLIETQAKAQAAIAKATGASA